LLGGHRVHRVGFGAIHPIRENLAAAELELDAQTMDDIG
jgi:hypothetical protein